MGREEKDYQLLPEGVGGSEEGLRFNTTNGDRHNSGGVAGQDSGIVNEIGSISVLKIDPLSLPSLPLSSYQLLPECPACYIAISETNEILYIGRARNLLERWKLHRRYEQLTSYPNVRIAWLQYNNHTLLPEVEAVLIEALKPLLNKKLIPPTKKIDSKVKQCELRVRMTKTEFDKLKEIAEERHLTVSELVRYTCRLLWDSVDTNS